MTMTTTFNKTKTTAVETTYVTGDWFIHEQHGLCVLAADDTSVGMVFTSGDTYIDFVPLKDIYGDLGNQISDGKFQFTKDQFDTIVDGDAHLFEYVEEVSIGFKTSN